MEPVSIEQLEHITSKLQNVGYDLDHNEFGNIWKDHRLTQDHQWEKFRAYDRSIIQYICYLNKGDGRQHFLKYLLAKTNDEIETVGELYHCGGCKMLFKEVDGVHITVGSEDKFYCKKCYSGICSGQQL